MQIIILKYSVQHYLEQFSSRWTTLKEGLSEEKKHGNDGNSRPHRDQEFAQPLDPDQNYASNDNGYAPEASKDR